MATFTTRFVEVTPVDRGLVEVEIDIDLDDVESQFSIEEMLDYIGAEKCKKYFGLVDAE